MIKQSLFFFFALFVFGQMLLAQNALDEVTVKLSLNGEPTLEGVGFDNPNSYWKVKYTLRIVEGSVSGNNSNPRKLKLKITKGSFKRKQLATGENRIFSTNVIFDNKIKQILSSAKPYSMLFRVQFQAKSYLSKKRKIKGDVEFEWDLSSGAIFSVIDGTIGAAIMVTRESDGGFGYSIFRD